MPIQLFRCLQIGDGSEENPYRSKLSDYIGYINGEDFGSFDDWLNFSRPVRYCLAFSTSDRFALALADIDIQAISPEFATKEDLNLWLNGLWSTMSPAATTILENDGFPMDWVTAGTTKRQVLLYLSKYHGIIQTMSGAMELRALEFLVKNLDEIISNIDIEIRNKIANWMNRRGLDTGWITGSTKVREVVKYIIQNISISEKLWNI